MAAKSGMRYDMVLELITFLENQARDISGILNGLIEEMPGKISAAYTGQAATSYKETLVNTAKSMDQTMNDLITNLKNSTSERQADYAAQDQKLQDSTSGPTSTTV